MSSRLSDGQKMFISEGFKQNIRGDGRKNNELREIIVKRGELRQANGSSFVSLFDRSVNIYTGIKIELGETKNDEGKILLKIESAQRSEKTRDAEAHINSDKNTIEFMEAIMNEHLIANINKKHLCIVPGKKCWVINVDIFILEGIQLAFLEHISFGINSAIENLILPKVTIAHNNLTNEDEITLLEEQFQTLSLQSELNMPRIYLIGQDKRVLISDLTVEEFYSVENKYIVVVDQVNKKIISIKKTGSGSLLPDDFARIAQFSLQATAALNA